MPCKDTQDIVYAVVFAIHRGMTVVSRQISNGNGIGSCIAHLQSSMRLTIRTMWWDRTSAYQAPSGSRYPSMCMISPHHPTHRCMWIEQVHVPLCCFIVRNSHHVTYVLNTTLFSFPSRQRDMYVAIYLQIFENWRVFLPNQKLAECTHSNQSFNCTLALPKPNR